MRTLNRIVLALSLLVVGYILGSTHVLTFTPLFAQDGDDGMSQETADAIIAAREAANNAMQALQQDDKYIPIIDGLNAFVATVGEVNAFQDLESGRGVDPETFAGLYAGLAVEDVAQHLDKDGEGRLTYKNKVVRMYPISRIKQMFAVRSRSAEDTPADN